jgi:hypothetical protein
MALSLDGYAHSVVRIVFVLCFHDFIMLVFRCSGRGMNDILVLLVEES